MDKAQKTEALDVLKGIFASAGVIVVAHYAGMTVAEMTDLRGKLRAEQGSLKVVKNRLAKLALEGTPGVVGAPLFQGPAAIVYSSDAVSVAKTVLNYAKENDNFILQGGILGSSVLDEKGIEALSKMPSLDEMRAKLVGSLNAPGGMLARTLNAPGNDFATALGGVGRNLASVLAQKQAQMEAA
ncbi:MAG: 50S ribosomal protein L10 [Pseudomonadota bacterium]